MTSPTPYILDSLIFLPSIYLTTLPFSFVRRWQPQNRTFTPMHW
jgi:hypothetical protein